MKGLDEGLFREIQNTPDEFQTILQLLFVCCIVCVLYCTAINATTTVVVRFIFLEADITFLSIYQQLLQLLERLRIY